jgi:hypothetical protein
MSGHDHGTGNIKHEKPLWWAFGLTATFLVTELRCDEGIRAPGAAR